MKTNYVDFVLCKHPNNGHNWLFRAPGFSGLKKGDAVMVDTKFGVRNATVVSVVTVKRDDKQMIDFVMNATGADADVKKVLSKVTYAVIDYADEDEDGVTQD